MPGLFSNLLGAAVQGGAARRAGLNQGEQVRLQRQKQAQDDARQQQMDLLQQAVGQSLIADRTTDNQRQTESLQAQADRWQKEFEQRNAFHNDTEQHADRRDALMAERLSRVGANGGLSPYQHSQVLQRAVSGTALQLAGPERDYARTHPGHNVEGTVRNMLRQQYLTDLSSEFGPEMAEGLIRGAAAAAVSRRQTEELQVRKDGRAQARMPPTPEERRQRLLETYGKNP